MNEWILYSCTNSAQPCGFYKTPKKKDCYSHREQVIQLNSFHGHKIEEIQLKPVPKQNILPFLPGLANKVCNKNRFQFQFLIMVQLSIKSRTK